MEMRIGRGPLFPSEVLAEIEDLYEDKHLRLIYEVSRLMPHDLHVTVLQVDIYQKGAASQKP